jgi:pimeloyl-ACP methyl ester carboxylesterase
LSNRRFIPTFLALLLLLTVTLPAGAQIFSTNRPRPDAGPQLKSVHGSVQDLQGKPLAGALIMVRDTKSSVTRSATTDAQGLYSITGLSPAGEYEVTAEFKSQKAPEKRTISSFLDRQDYVFNFQISSPVDAAAAGAGAKGGAEFLSYDLVRLRASFDMPQGLQAPIPSILLLHGYGEDRSVWNPLKAELLSRGWAVMALDLRGHGESTMKNGNPLHADPAWRTDAHEVPLDLNPALDWLKAQPRLNSRKIVVIGYDVGADLALIASGKFPEVRTVIALNPKLDEILSMTGSAQDFQPRSALIVTSSVEEGPRLKPLVKAPVEIATRQYPDGAAQWAANKTLQADILRWLKDTY